MKNVLQQAELLANSILDSETYINMRISEQAAMHDEQSVKKMTDFMERRQQVEAILADPQMDHGELAKASEAMENAESEMNNDPLIAKMQADRSAFSQMMANVNKIIRFVVTGEDEEEAAPGCGGNCSSDGCSGCSGCGH